MANKPTSIETASKEAAAQPAAADPADALPRDPQAQAEEEAGVRSPDGSGTKQKEPKPEDYPASAKVTPPAEQINSSLSQVVGHAAPPMQSGVFGDSVEKATEKAEDSINAAREKVDQEFGRRAADA